MKPMSRIAGEILPEEYVVEPRVVSPGKKPGRRRHRPSSRARKARKKH
jgi:hypothetical protein